MSTPRPPLPLLAFARLAAFVAPIVTGAILRAVDIAAEMPLRAVPPAAAGAVPPRPWPPNAFLPLTEARIAELPAEPQATWRSYLAESKRRGAALPARDLVDHSATKPLAGPPIGSSYSKGLELHGRPAFYATEEARATADRVAHWQLATGGWTKSGDYTRDRRPSDDHHDAWSGGTFDNDATIYELRFLALVINASQDPARNRTWEASFHRGFDYVLAAQYPNGGFPQIYPLVGWYHDAITFNDDAMAHILELLRDVAARRPPFGFATTEEAEKARHALGRGIACVLACQLRTPAGRLLVWGQQHDPLSLQPCAARNFEPISACTNESAGLVRFLMSIAHPTPEVARAVEAAVHWFEATALHGVAWDRRATSGDGLQPKPGSPPLWARFYELESARPVFGERDRTSHYAVTELSDERRLGYGWFNTRAAELPAAYAAWKKGRTE